MKKLVTTALLLSVIAGISAISTQAVTGFNEKERGYISLSTSANTEVAPDVAELSFTVKTSDPKSLL